MIQGTGQYRGVGQAVSPRRWITTAAGLTVAIPALFLPSLSYLCADVEELVIAMEQEATKAGWKSLQGNREVEACRAAGKSVPCRQHTQGSLTVELPTQKT